MLCAAMPLAASADDSPLGMSMVETKDLKLIYLDSLRYLAPHAVRTFTNSMAWQKRMFGWEPSEATVILLKDFSDIGGAATGAAPHSTIEYQIAPISHAFETFPASERFYSLMNHELIHVVQGDIANDEDRAWRRFFLGKVAATPAHPETLLYSYLTVPRFTAPRWYVEGSAVFMETWMAGGLGRAQGGYDEMVFRAMARDDAHFYDTLGIESVGQRSDFQTGVNAYLYGTRFMTWLAYEYGPEKVIGWLRRDAGSARYYADNFRVVFGRELDGAWQDWIAFERDFQRSNLAEVRKHPITPFRPFAAGGIGSVSRVFYDEATGVLYGAFRYPGVVEHIAAVNTRDGTVRRLVDVKGGIHYKVASVAFDAATGTIFYSDDNLAFRDLMAVDVKTGASRMLLKNARIGDLAFNAVDRTLWGIEISDGIAYLVRVPYPYDDWYRVRTFPYEAVPYDLDVSPDGKFLSASMSEASSDQFVRVWRIDRLLKGDVTPMSEFKFGQSIPESFAFSKDGRYLYGSSYYTGASNVFRYEVANGDIQGVSNAETGFFRPVPLADGRLVVLAYTAAGFVPGTIDPKPIEDVSAITFLGSEVARKYPVVTGWQVPPPSVVDYDALITAQEAPFDPRRRLQLDNGIPILQGYKDSVGVGYRLNFSDPLGYANLSVAAAVTPDTDLSRDERAHFMVTGNYLGWHGEASWNRSDFYDIFGPTKRSRKGLALKGGYDYIAIYEPPRKLNIKADIMFYDNIDTLPNAQNVETLTFDRLLTGEIGAYYTDVRRSIGAVDDEKGIEWSIVATGNRVSGQNIGQLRGNFDYGWALPIANSSLWLRTAAGIATNERNNPVANYYFGSFGNNYVDNRSIKRYREYDSFPGFDIDEISGLSFVRPMVEWNLPPVALERAGVQGFHVQWMRPAVFASGLWTDPNRPTYRKDYQNVGGQLDFHFSVLHWYNMKLSIGYAAGYQGGRYKGDEWMVSLKIM